MYNIEIFFYKKEFHLFDPVTYTAQQQFNYGAQASWQTNHYVCTVSYGLLSIPFLVGTYKLLRIIYGIIWAIKAAHRPWSAEVDSINILFLIILDWKNGLLVLDF